MTRDEVAVGSRDGQAGAGESAGAGYPRRIRGDSASAWLLTGPSTGLSVKLAGLLVKLLVKLLAGLLVGRPRRAARQTQTYKDRG